MPPKHWKRWALVTAIAVVIGTVAAVMFLIASGRPGQRGLPDDVDKVQIEVRSKPAGILYYNLHKVGLTPVTLHVARSTTPIDLAISLRGHSLIKHVVPDHHQTVDFTVDGLPGAGAVPAQNR